MSNTTKQPWDAVLRGRLAQVLTDHAIVPNQDGFHGWRCEHPDRYADYCHCVPDLLDDLIAAVEALAIEGLGMVEELAKVKASLQREVDAQRASNDAPYYGNGIVYALIVIDKYLSPAVSPNQVTR